MAKLKKKKGKTSKKPIAIAYTDIHHREKHNYDSKPYQRLGYSLNIMAHVETVARNHNVPVLFAGDLMHIPGHMGNVLFSKFVKFYKDTHEKNRTKFIGISGNHDMNSYNSREKRSTSFLQTFSEVFPTMECIDFDFIEEKGIVVHGIPYLDNEEELLEELKRAQKNIVEGKINIVMYHGTWPGVKHDNGTKAEVGFTVTPKHLKGFDFILTGHIHKNQVLGKNILNIGSPYQQDWGEADNKCGYYILYSDKTFDFITFKGIAPVYIRLEDGEEKPEGDTFNIYEKKVAKPKKKKKLKSRKANSTNEDLVKEFAKTTDSSEERITLLIRYVKKSMQ